MSEIIIKEQNKQRIIEAINKPQYRATERCLTYDLIQRCIESAMNRLSMVSKTKLEGTVLHITQQQSFGRSYKFTPMSTQCKIIYSKGSWRLCSDTVVRDRCPNKDSIYLYTMHLSAGAKMEVLRAYE